MSKTNTNTHRILANGTKQVNWQNKDNIEIVQEEISKSPSNLTAGFEIASVRIGFTNMASVSAAYYGFIKHMDSNFEIASRDVLLTNTKNIARSVKNDYGTLMDTLVTKVENGNMRQVTTVSFYRF